MSSVKESQYLVAGLRLITASIWLNAGVLGKLLNPGFLDPNSNEYVGITIQYLAQGSVIKGFLYAVAFPHPILVGELVLIGEIIFGVFLLLGLFVRLTSTAAFYTNLIYFLSAAWTGAEEYGLNLLMMIVELYLIIHGSDNLSLEHLIKRKAKLIDSKLWIVVSSVIYSLVILYLYISSL